ncbi:MAG TPA: hypothetical protein VFB43_01575 [Terracidiphilus sp.]|nr:hypothetical protein [Terracidiphilus sp.]
MGPSFEHKFHHALGFAAVFVLMGCHADQQASVSANSSDASQPVQQEQAASDPASANLAPALYAAGTAPPPATAQEDGTAVLPNAPTNYDGNVSAQPYDDSADEADYGIEPDDTANDPPPPLPEYDQPPCPGDDYIWTPGYWYYTPADGYYWVPGAWVQVPYEGALWTPGYWAYSRGRYAFYHGYWGPHIGFYGGVNYGFGYVGFGYQGGYWNHGHFDYNRAVNNINVNQVHYVYNYRIENRNVTRVSYVGGSGGLRARPRPAEIAAFREPHAAPMHTQIEIRQSAGSNRGQFAANHGRPQQFTAPRPLAADPNVHPIEPRGLHNLPPATPRSFAQGQQNQAPESRDPGNRSPENRGLENRGEANRPQPNQPEPYQPGPNRAAPFRGAPNQPEPNRPAPNHVEPNPSRQPYHIQPNRTEPSPPAPNRPEMNHREPPQGQPNEPGPAHTMPGRREGPPEQHTQPNQPAPPEHHQLPSHPMPEQHAQPNSPAPERHGAPEQHGQSQPHHEEHPHL